MNRYEQLAAFFTAWKESEQITDKRTVEYKASRDQLLVQAERVENSPTGAAPVPAVDQSVAEFRRLSQSISYG